MIIHLGDQMEISVGSRRIALDSGVKGADISFVSHAHADHISGVRDGKKIISSLSTEKLIKARYGRQFEATAVEGVKMLNAGHILGSRQLYSEDTEAGYSVIYSGDYQMAYSKLAGHIEIANADILIIDSTYPYPSITFDDRGEVTERLVKFVESNLDKGIILFGAYAMGKAQEIISILNDNGIVPVVSRGIRKVNQVYNEFGAGLKYFSAYDDNSEFDSIVKRNFVGIVEVKVLNEIARKLSELHRKKTFTVVATGFAKMFKFDTDAQFPLSDHADFKQAIEYIDACTPKYIFTCGKNDRIFAKNLNEVGYKAYPISQYAGCLPLQVLGEELK